MNMRAWAPWLIVASVIILLPLLGDGLTAVLRYGRQATLNGELWRLITAHWVHLSLVHAALNAAALLLILSLLRGPGTWFSLELGLLVGCQLGVGALLLLRPDVDWYVGLSGALHGYVLVLAVFGYRYRTAWLILALLTAKVGLELGGGPSPWLEALIGGHVLVGAHLYGTVTGLLLSGAILLSRCSRSDRRP